jgi:SWI/SNF-related matrix-associated actin-dependent regulator 1 of chromatin subfamily A
MALFRKNGTPSPSPAEPPTVVDTVPAAQLAADATASALAAARDEAAAAAADTARAADHSAFPGDDTDAALAQLLAQRAAAKRTTVAADALARAEVARVEAAAALAAEVHAKLSREAEQFNWPTEWAGRALVAGVTATPEGRPVQGLEAAVALCRQAVSDRTALGEELAAAGITPPTAPRLSIASALADLLDPTPGLLGVYLTAAAVIRFQADLPRREKEIADALARADIDAKAHDRRMALAGHQGPEAQQAAAEQQRAELANYYGRSPSDLIAAQLADLIAAGQGEG